MIPDFTDKGLLPVGIHSATLEEISLKFNFSVKRKKLLIGLKKSIKHLKQVGCTKIYLDGSFVTSKHSPGDFDAIWSVVGLDLAQAILIHPVFGDFSDGRKNQKALYGGEFYPSNYIEGQSQEPFLTFFQKTKDDGIFKGIIELKI